ncbi:MerR family transcriptional regulator [Paenibacillus sp. TRM 82003]|nr:MerR family transcriptional regulator [Paenibacillus sp. TRM 82003]
MTEKLKEQESYAIGEFAEKTGTPIRTMHYYDEIGLLKPEKRPDNGRRTYRAHDIVTLHKIYSFKFLGFSLEQIKSVLHHPSYDMTLTETLKLHRRALEAKRDEIEASLRAIHRTVAALEGEGELDSQALFSLVRNMQQEKDQQAWLAEQVSETVAGKLFGQSEADRIALDKRFLDFTKDVKRLSGRAPDDPEAEAFIASYLHFVYELVGQDGVEALKRIEADRVAELEGMLQTPFTAKEEAWVQRAVEVYLGKHGPPTKEPRA